MTARLTLRGVLTTAFTALLTFALVISVQPAQAFDEPNEALDDSSSETQSEFFEDEAAAGPLEGELGKPGDPVWDGVEMPAEAFADGLKADPLNTSGSPALSTNAITSAYIDTETETVYGATRSAVPAKLFARKLDGTQAHSPITLKHGQGSWDMARSGNRLAIGLTGARGSNETWVARYNMSTGKIDKYIKIPNSNIVMSVVEDSMLATQGNGRYFWVGTYHANGARLFRVDFGATSAAQQVTDYSPSGWRSSNLNTRKTYVRSLAVHDEAVTIGVGMFAEVWRLTKARAQSKSTAQFLNLASAPFKTNVPPFAEASTAYAAAPSHATNSIVMGTSSPAKLNVVHATQNTSRASHLVDGENAIDRIAVHEGTDTTPATAWLTTRPSNALYSLDLTNSEATPQRVSEAIYRGSETRALAVSEDGNTVYGVSGTGKPWSLDVANPSDPTEHAHLISASQESRDLTVQGVTRFGNATLVGGHWRYQTHGPGGRSVIPLNGEPKAETVVGDTLYSALYPSATVQKITREGNGFNHEEIATIGNGQVRPAAIEHHDERGRLAVATGPAYGRYGGGISIIDPASPEGLTFYKNPVGNHQVTALSTYGKGFLLGTSTHGEAMPERGTAQVKFWEDTGNAATGRTHWTRSLPVAAERVTGMHTVHDSAGEFVVLSALEVGKPGQASRSYLIALDPARKGAVLWTQRMSGLTTFFSEANGYLVAQVAGKAMQLGATRSGVTITPVTKFNSSRTTTHLTLSETSPEMAYLSNGNIGLHKVTTPRTPHRVSGKDRYLTAVAVSQQTYKKADTVLLARGDEFADALAAGPLAAQLNAPILLVMHGNQLSKETKAEITRLGAKKAIPIGGTGALPNSLRNALPAGVSLRTSERLGGANRYETSVQVAKRLERELGRSVDVMAATGRNFADAITSVPAAVVTERAIVLYDHHSSARSAANFMKGKRVEALGGPAARGLKSAGIKLADETIGKDRFDTAAKIAAKHFKASSDTVYVAPGLSFPDGLTAGVAAGRQGTPMLLALPRSFEAPTENSIRRGAGTKKVFFVGGTGVLGTPLERRVTVL